MDFSDVLKQRRDHLSSGSLKTYNSLLKSIYKACWGSTKEPDVKNFDKTEEVMKFLKDKSPSSRKTYLAALVCICPDIDEYRTVMNKDMLDYKKEMDKQEMSEKQMEANISSEEIKAIYDDLAKTASLLYKKTKLSTSDLQQIQDFIIVALVSGVHIVPRRSLDYVEMKVRDINKDEDNYIEKGKFIFHKFKTAKFHEGGQSLDIPPVLKKILIKWISIIPKDVNRLLFNSNFQPLSNVTLNQRLNRIFKGPISINQMRHTYLTEKYGAMMKQEKQMADEMEDMGSSIKQAKVYVKLNDPDLPQNKKIVYEEELEEPEEPITKSKVKKGKATKKSIEI